MQHLQEIDVNDDTQLMAKLAHAASTANAVDVFEYALNNGALDHEFGRRSNNSPYEWLKSGLLNDQGDEVAEFLFQDEVRDKFQQSGHDIYRYEQDFLLFALAGDKNLETIKTIIQSSDNEGEADVLFEPEMQNGHESKLPFMKMRRAKDRFWKQICSKDSRSPSDLTPLAFAVSQGREDVLDYLLNDVATIDDDNLLFLTKWALSDGYVDEAQTSSLKKLLNSMEADELGDIDGVDAPYEEILTSTLSRRDSQENPGDVKQFLFEKYDFPERAIVGALAKYKPKDSLDKADIEHEVLPLLDRLNESTIEDENFEPTFHALKENLDYAEVLLEHGANPEVTKTIETDEGERTITPLHSDRLSESRETIKLLVEKYDVDPDIRSSDDKTPLEESLETQMNHKAYDTWEAEKRQALVEHGASLDVLSDVQCAELLLCLDYDDFEAVLGDNDFPEQFLLEQLDSIRALRNADREVSDNLKKAKRILDNVDPNKGFKRLLNSLTSDRDLVIPILKEAIKENAHAFSMESMHSVADKLCSDEQWEILVDLIETLQAEEIGSPKDWKKLGREISGSMTYACINQRVNNMSHHNSPKAAINRLYRLKDENDDDRSSLSHLLRAAEKENNKIFEKKKQDWLKEDKKHGSSTTRQKGEPAMTRDRRAVKNLFG